MKKVTSIIIILIILVGGYFLLNKKPDVSQAQPIKIGVAVSLTGYAGNWGEGEVKAIQLALDDYKSKISQPIELIIEDTKATDIGTVDAVKKLIEIDHVQAIIGPTWGDSFQGALPIAEKAQVTMLTPSAAIEAIPQRYTYLFSTWWPEDAEIKTLTDHVVKSGITRIAVVNDQDPFDSNFADRFIAKLNTLGKKDLVGTRIVVPVGSKDFRTNIAKIKADKSTAVFIQLQDTSLMGPFMKQLQEQNLKIAVYGTPDAENVDNITKFPGYFDGILYAFPSYAQDPSYAVLLGKLKAKYGADASQGPSFVNAYNAGTMMFEVLKNGSRTGTEIRDALNKVHVPGVGSKDLSFNAQGQIVDVTFIMKTIQNNQFMVLTQ